MAFLRDTALSAVSAVAGVGGRLLTTILLARSLPHEAYGQFVYLQWVIELTALICSFGLPGVLTRFLPELEGHRTEAGRAQMRWLAQLAAGSIALSVAVFVAYVLLDRTFGALNLFVLAAWCLASTAMSLQGAALQGLFRYDAATLGNLAFAVSAPLFILLFRSDLTVTAAVLSITAAYGLGILVSSLMRLTKPPRHGVAPAAGMQTRTILTYGASIWLTALISSLVWSRGEFAILRLHVPAGEIALYAAALSLAGAITTAAGLLSGALMPHLARLWATDDRAALRAILSGITQMTLISTTALAIVLIGFGKLVIALVFGASYVSAYPLLCVLAIAALSIACGGANTALQIATGGRFALFANILGLTVLFAFSAVLTPGLGIMGTAYARAISQIAVGFLTFGRLGGIPELRQASHRYIRAMGFGLASATALYLLVGYMPDGWLLRAAAVVLFVPATATGISLLVGTPLRAMLKLGAPEPSETS